MQDPTAVIGRRIVAYLIDSLIIFIVIFGVFFALSEDDGSNLSRDQLEHVADAFSGADGDSVQGRWSFNDQVGGFIDFGSATGQGRVVVGTSFWIVNLVGLAVSLGLIVVMQGATGKTPGKAIMGITTVSEDGSPPGIGKAIVRWILLVIDAGLCFLPGLISSLASKGHRRIGDMAAGTYVVQAAAAGKPVAVGGPMPAYATAGGSASYGVPPPPGGYAPQQQQAPAQPSGDAQWDANRGAWIRWDGAQWQQHDPATGGWHPIS